MSKHHEYNTTYQGYTPGFDQGETVAQLLDLEAQGFDVPLRRILNRYDQEQRAAEHAARVAQRDQDLEAARKDAAARVAAGDGFDGRSDDGYDSKFTPVA
ncbi:hypothetical protein [Corynebacterium nuruki]|uniref:hypothetical protein n=1 Tax=Corynebacterium nuruki TaxID=1032851 RepID=UPI0039BEE324